MLLRPSYLLIYAVSDILRHWRSFQSVSNIYALFEPLFTVLQIFPHHRWHTRLQQNHHSMLRLVGNASHFFKCNFSAHNHIWTLGLGLPLRFRKRSTCKQDGRAYSASMYPSLHWYHRFHHRICHRKLGCKILRIVC